MKQKEVLVFSLLAALTFFSVSPAYSLPLANGDFSSGLSGWSAVGEVSVDSGAAKLADGDGSGAALSQGVSIAASPATLTLDFFNALSNDPGNGFRDSIFATLYLTNDLTTFDAFNSATYLSAVDLFTFNGTDEQSSAGSFGSSALGQGWSLFTYNFNPSAAYVVLSFELIDLNFVSSDSYVKLDNIVITQGASTVPEPTTLLLVLPGLLAGHRRRKQSKSPLNG